MAKFKKLAIVSSSILATAMLASFGVACGEEVCNHNYEKKSDATHTWYACTNEGCDSIVGKEAIVVPHEHEFELKTDADKHWYGCKDATCTVKVGEGAHSWGEAVVVDPTTTANGSSTKTCVICGKEDTTAIVAKTATADDNGDLQLTENGVYVTTITEGEWYPTVSHFYYTATADGSITISTNNEKAQITVEDTTTYTTLMEKIGVSSTALYVAEGDVLDIKICVDPDNTFVDDENAEETLDVAFTFATSTEIPEADGSAKNPFTLTVADDTDEWNDGIDASVKYVGNDIYYTYTVTGDDTLGVVVSTWSSLIAIEQIDENNPWGAFRLSGTGNEAKAFAALTKGSVLTFKVSCGNFDVISANLTFNVCEVSEYEDGSEAYPIIIDAEGEYVGGMLYKSNPRMPGSITFKYTATADGTLAFEYATAFSATIISDADSDPVVSNAEADGCVSASLTVVNGVTYTITLSDTTWSETSYSGYFGFTATEANA